jgi:tetratricopeptide (TPR) repeat protein
MLAFRSSAGVTPVRWFLAGAVACFLAGVVAMPEPAYAEGGKGRVRIKKKTRLTRDSGDGEEYNQARAEALAVKRNALIFDIKRFLSTARDNDQKAELNLRLANLYREEYVANLAKAQSEFDQAMANFEKVQAKNPKAKAPVLDTTEALASLDRARGIYKDLLKQYPQHPRRDEMLFFLAQSSIDRGLNDEAMQYYKILLSEFPESRFSPDALVQLGDNYFDKNQWEQAETYYDEVMKRNFTPLLNYVHWRKGWCAYNTGRNAQAVQHFRWVVDNEDTIENTPIRVKNEALKDIALPFVELGVTDQAVAFYSMQGDHQNRRGLEAMAKERYFLLRALAQPRRKPPEESGLRRLDRGSVTGDGQHGRCRRAHRHALPALRAKIELARSQPSGPEDHEKRFREVRGNRAEVRVHGARGRSEDAERHALRVGEEALPQVHRVLPANAAHVEDSLLSRGNLFPAEELPAVGR